MTFKLYDFQVDDVNHLGLQRSAIFAHDMGTGKTVMATTREKLIRTTDDSGRTKTLVICRRRAMGHWRRHIAKVLPDLADKIYVYNKNSRGMWASLATNPDVPGVFVLYWEVLRTIPGLRKVRWLSLQADEVHRLGNPKSQRTLALKGLRTEYKTGCSGTLATTNPDNVWSVFNWLWPRYYNNYWKFRNYYFEQEKGYIQRPTGPGGKKELHDYKRIIGINVERLPELHAEIAPWYRRRLKEDVLSQLPPKYYSHYVVDLEPVQRKAYDEMRREKVAWVEDNEQREVPIVAKIVATQLQRLQQFAVSYATVERRKGKKWNEEKRQYDIVERDVVVMKEPSSKLDAVMEIIEDAGAQQIVVFTQFKQPVYLLVKRLQAAGISCGWLTSDVTDKAGDRMIEDFQDGKLKVFVSTIASGGESLDFYMASTVIFIDRAWSPSDNKQAEDRLHRSGQHNAVHVIDIIARDTVDLGRRQRIMRKWKWIKLLLGDKVDQELEKDPLQIAA